MAREAQQMGHGALLRQKPKVLAKETMATAKRIDMETKVAAKELRPDGCVRPVSVAVKARLQCKGRQAHDAWRDRISIDDSGDWQARAPREDLGRLCGAIANL
jgi:hypothetical protein